MFSRLRQFKRLSMVPVVLWLLLQFFMTGVLLPFQASASIGSDTSEYFTICTSDGFKYATWNDDGSFSYVSQADVNASQLGPEQHAERTNHCPLCLFSEKALLTSPGIDWAPHSILTTGPYWPSISVVSLNQPIKGYFLSRAPPSK